MSYGVRALRYRGSIWLSWGLIEPRREPLVDVSRSGLNALAAVAPAPEFVLACVERCLRRR